MCRFVIVEKYGIRFVNMLRFIIITFFFKFPLNKVYFQGTFVLQLNHYFGFMLSKYVTRKVRKTDNTMFPNLLRI